MSQITDVTSPNVIWSYITSHRCRFGWRSVINLIVVISIAFFLFVAFGGCLRRWRDEINLRITADNDPRYLNGGWVNHFCCFVSRLSIYFYFYHPIGAFSALFLRFSKKCFKITLRGTIKLSISRSRFTKSLWDVRDYPLPRISIILNHRRETVDDTRINTTQ